MSIYHYEQQAPKLDLNITLDILQTGTSPRRPCQTRRKSARHNKQLEIGQTSQPKQVAIFYSYLESLLAQITAQGMVQTIQ